MNLTKQLFSKSSVNNIQHAWNDITDIVKLRSQSKQGYFHFNCKNMNVICNRQFLL